MKARGLCNAHYKLRRQADPAFVVQRRGTPEERFWAKADIRGPDDCWPWTAFVDDDGYGIFGISAGRSVRAHRFAYEAAVRPVPKGYELDHLCHTRDLECMAGAECPHRRCVNPAHLEPVTSHINTLRGRGASALNAAREACERGHPLSGENLYLQRHGRGCRECRRERKRRQNAKIKAENQVAGRVANAAKTHCKHGHPLSGDNLYVTPSGRRSCRQCGADRAREKYRRERLAAAQ